MKHFALPSLALVAAASIFAVGCSSSSTGNANGSSSGSASAALGTFRAPTGTFQASNGSALFAEMGRQQKQGAAVGGSGGGQTGGLGTQAIVARVKKLTGDDVETGSDDGSEASCKEGAQCACEAGGTFSYALENASEGKALRLTFSDCGSADGSGFDGEALLVISQRALLEDKALPAYGNGQSVLLVASGTITEEGTSQKAEIALLSQPNVKLVAVKVDDGSVVIGQTSKGTVIVRAKDTAWTCNPSGASGYVCKEDNTGETVAIGTSGEDEGEGDVEAPPTKG